MIDKDKGATICCTQINLNHSKLAQDKVGNKIKKKLNTNSTPLFFLIQEPYIHKSKHAKKDPIM